MNTGDLLVIPITETSNDGLDVSGVSWDHCRASKHGTRIAATIGRGWGMPEPSLAGEIQSAKMLANEIQDWQRVCLCLFPGRPAGWQRSSLPCPAISFSSGIFLGSALWLLAPLSPLMADGIAGVLLLNTLCSSSYTVTALYCWYGLKFKFNLFC